MTGGVRIPPHIVAGVLRAYLANVKVEAIAYEFGIHHSTVSKLAKRAGIAPRTNRGIVKLKETAKMRSRNALHRNKLKEFEAWAASLGYVREPCKGTFEVLRLRHKDARAPLVYYERAADANGTGDGSTHITAFGDGEKLVRRWLRERKVAKGT